MAKLYLVRRNLEVFTGPMTLAEMKDAYKRMQFGLQDEVAGHCGPWVAFENLERIKKQYPEVARLVHEDMVAGWNLSSDNEGKLINEDTKHIAIKSMRGVGLALTFLLIALAAFVAALYMATSNKTSQKPKDQMESALRPEDLRSLLDQHNAPGFDEYLQQHMPEIVTQVKWQKDEAKIWLPYLRIYAFTRDGQISGLDPKYLRGATATAAPIDCSLRMWHRRWAASSKNWNDLLDGKQFVQAHWARLIAWDPYWIKRREHPGWIGEQNYYTACLDMADRALTDVAKDLSGGLTPLDYDRRGYAKIKARLAWLRDAVRGKDSPAPPLDLSTTGLWTCFEAARDVTTLNQCRRAAKGVDAGSWAAYNDERYSWNLLRIAAARRGPLPLDLTQLMQEQERKINKEDHFTRFDYDPESSLFKSLLKANLPAEKAVEQTQSQYPDVKMSH